MALLNRGVPLFLLVACAGCQAESARVDMIPQAVQARLIEDDDGALRIEGSFILDVHSQNVTGRSFLHAFADDRTTLVSVEPPGPWRLSAGESTQLGFSWEIDPAPDAAAGAFLVFPIQLVVEGRGVLPTTFVNASVEGLDTPQPPPPPPPCGDIVGAGMGGLPGDAIWAHRMGGSGEVHAEDVAVGPSGETVVVGTYALGPLSMPPLFLFTPQVTTAFVAKVLPDGTPEWAFALADTPVPTVAHEVEIDGEGNIYLAGALDPEASSLTLQKLSPDGLQLWRAPLTAAGETVLALDAAGGAVLTTACDDLCGAGAEPSDPAVTRFAPDGAHQWSHPLSSTNLEVHAKALASRADGGVIVAGDLRQQSATSPTTIDFGGGPLVKDGVDDMFLLRLTAAGEHVWSRRFGERGPLHAEAVTLRTDGNVLLAGGIQGEVDFGGGPMSSVAPTVGHAFVVELDEQASFVRQLLTRGTGIATATDVEVRSDGRVALLGTFDLLMSVDDIDLVSGGLRDVFQLELSPGLKLGFARRFGEGCDEGDPRMALAGDAVTLITNSPGRIDFGTGLFGSEATDAYVARFP